MNDTPEANEFQKKIDSLAAAAERTQRAAGYKILLSPAKELHRDSQWALLLVGGTLALLVPNLKDLLEVYSLRPLQAALALLLISGVLGLVAKSVYSLVEDAFRGRDEHADAWIASVKEYSDQLKKIREEAQAVGVEVKDTLDYVAFLKPVEDHSPRAMRMIAKDHFAAEKNPDHQWKKTMKWSGVHTRLVCSQMGFIFVAFILLLVFVNEPNKPPEPTTTAVTPPATQESRQR